jgi:hypothetical protein
MSQTSRFLSFSIFVYALGLYILESTLSYNYFIKSNEEGIIPKKATHGLFSTKKDSTSGWWFNDTLKKENA